MYAQRFNASGTPQGGEFRLNTTTALDQQRPALALQPGGNFVAVWRGNGPGDTDGLFLQRYTLETTEAGDTTTSPSR